MQRNVNMSSHENSGPGAFEVQTMGNMVSRKERLWGGM